MMLCRTIGLMLLFVGPVLCLAEEGNLVKNGDFDRDVSGWSFWFATGEGEGKAQWVARDDGGALQVEVNRRERSSSVQIYYGPFSVAKGKRYEIAFQARAQEPWMLRVSLMRHEAPYGTLGLSAEVPVADEWRSYSLIATATVDCDIARIDFFPEKNLLLDAVSVRSAPAEENLVKPTSVHLGRDWIGDPTALLDDNPGTRVHSRSCPIQPLFVVADLGEPKAVQQVVIGSFDGGRHSYTRRVDVEVSDDGQRWFVWAQGVKDGPSGLSKPRHTGFQASSVAVRARYLRLRVSGVVGGAVLTGLSVFAADAEAGMDTSLLPEVQPAQDLAFLGWDYGRLGYAVTPGERVALRWANQGSADVSAPVAWQLATYDGQELARGDAMLHAPPDGTGEVAIPLPQKLDDGPKMVHCKFAEEAKLPPQLFYFDYRAAPGDDALDLTVVALLDNQDPEGWARMMAGPLARHVTALRDWPEDGARVDAALVMAENWREDDPRVSKLKDYVRGGGKALVYGKPAGALAEMIPVVVDPDQPWLEKPSRLRLLESGPWSGFEPGNGPVHYGLKASAKAGARVLAQWEDGTPAVVEGDFGGGKVAFVGAGSGQVWQHRREMKGADELGLRLLYRLAGREEAVGAMLERAAQFAETDRAEHQAVLARVLDQPGIPQPENAVVLSRNNVGRFGWQIEEGGLVENLSEEAEMRCPADPNHPWSLVVNGAGELTGRSVEQNWLAKTVAWSDGQGEIMRSTVSMASPGILWEGSARQIAVKAAGVTHLAYPAEGGVRIMAMADGSGRLDDMAGNWFVLFTAEEQHRDVPRLVVLTRRPTSLRPEGGLALSFDEGGFGALFTSRLWGLRRLAPGETNSWVRGLPPEAIEAAQRWSRAFLSFPVACDEVAWVEGDTVAVADRFRFRTFADSWSTPPLSLAALPPVLSLAGRDGAPVQLPKDMSDCQMATKYGPLKAVQGDALLYRIPLPPHDHYGVIPVEGQMDLQEAIDHYALDGIGSVTSASGGLTSSTAFLEDLRAYMSSGSFPPFEAPCIDLYKWWYCFPSVLGRPAYAEEARSQVDAHYRRQYWQTLNFYPHKCFVRYRREPWTGIDYTISFIWPTMFKDGVRYFVDQNESSAVIAYCFASYARYYGDWDTLRANWNLCRRLHEYLPKFHDWTWMASSNQEFFSTAGIDMLNSEYPGNLAFAQAARQVGDREGETLGLVLAAKSLVPAVARFAMPDYVRSITAEGDPWRDDRYYYSFTETGLDGVKTIEMRGGPESILHLAIGMLDTSKGTSPEIVLAYKSWIPRRIEAYERELKAAEAQYNLPVGWMHLMQRAVLRWPRAELVATAKKFHEVLPRWGWQSTKGPHNMAVICVADTPLFLADWSPAEYLSGRYDPERCEVTLRFRAHEDVPYAIRLYSQREPKQVLVNDKQASNASYDAKTGWLVLDLKGPDEKKIVIRLGEPTAPLHPYFAEGER